MVATRQSDKKKTKSRRGIRLIVSLALLAFAASVRLLSPSITEKAGKVILPVIEGDTNFEEVFRRVGSFAKEKAGGVFSFFSNNEETAEDSENNEDGNGAAEAVDTTEGGDTGT